MGDIEVLHALAWPTVPDTRVRRKSPAQVARELEQLAGELWGSGVGDSLPNELLAVAHELRAFAAGVDHASAVDLERLCAHCGHERGDHLSEAPQACEYGCRCPGYQEPGAYAVHDTERPPAAPAFEEEPHIELAFPSALRGRP